jgi:hypothetical protein
MGIIKDVTYKNHLVRVTEYEGDVDFPRDYDNLGTIITLHNLIDYSDRGAPYLKMSDFSGWEEVEEHLRKEHGAVVMLPIYIISHSGHYLSTEPFNDPGDSGRLGVIYTTRETYQSQRTFKRLTKKLKEEAEAILRGEVEALSHFVSGEYYAYVIDPEDDDDEAGKFELCCSAYYDVDEAEEASKRDVDSLAAYDEEMEFIHKLPLSDLPKYINHTWKFPKGVEDEFKKRLQGG